MFSTIRKADRIAVLQRGVMVELGTHGDLIAHGGLYAQQHREQTGYQEAAQVAFTT